MNPPGDAIYLRRALDACKSCLNGVFLYQQPVILGPLRYDGRCQLWLLRFINKSGGDIDTAFDLTLSLRDWVQEGAPVPV